MNNSFIQLFLSNLKIVYRNRSGIFWTVLMPSFIYIALSILPIGKMIGSQITYSNYVLPGIIAMTIMQGGIYGLAYWVADMKALGVIKRFLVTPLKIWELILSLVASRTIVMFVQVVLLTLLGTIVFKAHFAGNIISTSILVVLGGGIFLLIGLLIGNFATSYDAAAPITSAIVLPMTFLGNIFYPTDSLPQTLRIVAKILPVTYLAEGLRQAYLFPFSFQIILKDICVLGVWLIVMLVVTISLFRLKT